MGVATRPGGSSCAGWPGGGIARAAAPLILKPPTPTLFWVKKAGLGSGPGGFCSKTYGGLL